MNLIYFSRQSMLKMAEHGAQSNILWNRPARNLHHGNAMVNSVEHMILLVPPHLLSRTPTIFMIYIFKADSPDLPHNVTPQDLMRVKPATNPSCTSITVHLPIEWSKLHHGDVFAYARVIAEDAIETIRRGLAVNIDQTMSG
jgi:hypothetical protein